MLKKIFKSLTIVAITLFATAACGSHFEDNPPGQVINMQEYTHIPLAFEGVHNMDYEANPFIQFDFFIESKLDQYIEFSYKNPHLSYEYIVWKINAGLNREFFYNPHTISAAHPLLVNPFNRLDYDFVPYQLETIGNSNFQATPQAVSAFNKLQAYAATHGHNLWVASAYRSIYTQRNLYERNGHLGTIARPGHSEHHTGRAIDLGGPLGLLDMPYEVATSPAALWLVDNVYAFGFIIRYTYENSRITGFPGEPWHITYVTREVSYAMQNGGYNSLEEFVARNPSFVFNPN
ncbi:MAG: M15 family metallopeptidase [Defluviitaleaceae bacterium]|nr:M15 family metallopeptidase [Defluviitaleaceae bacterium]